MRTILIAAAILMCWGEVTPAQAGCNITLGVKNTGKGEIFIFRKESKVKVKGGTWKQLSKLSWYPGSPSNKPGYQPGESGSDDFKAQFKCGAKRRYMIKYRCAALPGHLRKSVYYPSDTGYTTSTSNNSKKELIINLPGC